MSIADRNAVQKAMQDYLTDEAKRDIKHLTRLVISHLAVKKYLKELDKKDNK